MKTKWTHVLLSEATRDRIDAEVRRRRQADGGRHSRASVVAWWAERCEGEAARQVDLDRAAATWIGERETLAGARRGCGMAGSGRGGVGLVAGADLSGSAAAGADVAAAERRARGGT